ncbi:hypothetical protein D3C87_1909620 [compost metagenome]
MVDPPSLHHEGANLCGEYLVSDEVSGFLRRLLQHSRVQGVPCFRRGVEPEVLLGAVVEPWGSRTVWALEFLEQFLTI